MINKFYSVQSFADVSFFFFKTFLFCLSCNCASSRGKRMRCPLTSECVSSGGTDKENTSRGTTEDEEVVLKKQKTKVRK